MALGIAGFLCDAHDFCRFPSLMSCRLFFLFNCRRIDTFDKLPQAPLPEIQRTNIAQVLLQLKVLGIASPAAFPFLSPPTDVSLRKALELLLMVEAIGKVSVFPLLCVCCQHVVGVSGFNGWSIRSLRAMQA